MPTTKAEVRLDHKTGPVVISITAQDPKIAAYMANRIKELFNGKKAEDTTDALMRAMGLKP